MWIDVMWRFFAQLWSKFIGQSVKVALLRKTVSAKPTAISCKRIDKVNGDGCVHRA